MKITLLLATVLSFTAFQAPARAADESGFGYRIVSPGIFRGGRPAKEERMQWLSGQGIRSIVNLQGAGSKFQPGESEEEIAASEEIAKRLGISYHRKPFTVGKSHTLSPEERAHVLAAVELLKDPANHPIYVHCFFGVDRTGITIASFRILGQGCSFEKARDEMYREGGPWTKYVTEGQLPFLQELTQMPRPGESECPL